MSSSSQDLDLDLGTAKCCELACATRVSDYSMFFSGTCQSSLVVQRPLGADKIVDELSKGGEARGAIMLSSA